jgi:hypothetical protein
MIEWNVEGLVGEAVPVWVIRRYEEDVGDLRKEG